MIQLYYGKNKLNKEIMIMARSGGPGSFVFGEEERKEVMEVLEGRYLFRYGAADAEGYTHKVVDFEDALKNTMGAKYAVATTSGTCSLLASLAALGIGGGDEVIVPGYTFIASISTIMLSGAIPVLAEIDESLTIDVTKIEELITPKTKAILPVHMLGNPCKMDAIMEIAKKHNLYVLEDCCQAVGASYKGKRCGTYGNIVRDYNPDHELTSKIIRDIQVMYPIAKLETGEQPFDKFPAIYYFDTVKGVGFVPTDYVDITDYFETKRQMFLCHESQQQWMADNYKGYSYNNKKFTESMEIQSRYRGLQCGVTYAEGFVRCMDAYKIVHQIYCHKFN